MENKKESKSQIVVRIKNSVNPYELAAKHGFSQRKNGIEMPNVNKMMITLYEFAVKMDSTDIDLSILNEESFLAFIKKYAQHG